jgi:protein TonB
MFESLALEDPRNTRRRWTTAASFALEALAVGVLILAPLGYTEAISLRVDKPLVVPQGRTNIETQTPPPKPNPATKPTTEFVGSHLMMPQRIPAITHPIDDGNRLPNVGTDFTGPFVVGSTGPQGDSTLNQLLASNNKPIVERAATISHGPLSISHLDPGMLIKQVQPIYPKIAVISHTEGTVLLAAVIDTQGRITQLRALHGHPLLIPAALDAVQLWRYKPYILNGTAVEVETQVSVVFTLQR